MYKIRRYISNNFILIFILSTIMLFVSLGASYIKEYSNQIYEQNYYMDKNCTGFSVTNFQKFSYNKLLDMILKSGDVNIFNTRMVGTEFSAQGIYLKENLKFTPELIEGRFFNKDDFKDSDEKLAVIGKELINETTKKGEYRYITFNKEEYRIIGIMGNEKKQKMFDYTMIFNINSLMNNENYMKISDGWYISSYNNKNLSGLITEVNQHLSELGEDSTLMEEEANIQPNPTITALKNNINMACYFLVLIGAIALNIFIVVYQWIGELEKQIGIRKAFGAQKYQIYCLIFKNYIICSGIASVFALLTQMLLLKIGFFQVNEEITLFNFVIVGVSSFVFSAILLCASIGKLNKLQPSNIMKGV